MAVTLCAQVQHPLPIKECNIICDACLNTLGRESKVIALPFLYYYLRFSNYYY